MGTLKSGVGNFMILSEQDIRRIDEVSMSILSDIGIKVNHPELLKRLRDEGAMVDFETAVVKMPGDLVKRSIKRCSGKHILYGRNHERLALFGYGRPNFLSSAGQYSWIERSAGKRRAPTLDDVRKAITVGDALEGIDVVGAFAMATDVPPEVRDVHLHAELLKGTTKPCAAWIVNGRTARYVIELFKIVAGGEFALKERPMLEGFIEAISPLQYARDSLDILIEFARAGLPIGFGPMAMTMATAPVTLAGTIAQENAEILGGIVIAQILSPGLPVTYWGIPHIMDPTSGLISFGSPEQGLMASAMAQIGKAYGLAVGVNVGLSDSKCLDAQSGLERGMSLLMGALSGADILGHMGICGADQGANLEQLIIDNEMAGYLRRILKGFSINTDTLALDIIKEIGIGGNFLTHSHTVEHFRQELWIPQLHDRNNWDIWKSKGGLSIAERAKERIDNILKSHKVEPLDEKLGEEIDRIVSKADEDIIG